MGLDRKLSRAASRRLKGKPPFQPLRLLEGLGEAAGAAQVVQEQLGALKGIVVELEADRTTLHGAVEAAGAFQQELNRQRAVFKMATAGFQQELDRQRAVFTRFLISNDTLFTPGPERYAKFLAVESRYRKEYDALCFLVQLISWAKEAP